MLADNQHSNQRVQFTEIGQSSTIANDVLNAGLERVIDSIIAIADIETESLRTGQVFDISTMTMRKTRLLHDYSIAARSLKPQMIAPEIRAKLKRMSVVLDQNIRQYKAHTSALKEIVTIIAEAEQEQRTDGTYDIKRFYGA